jgi:hypothetical protein
MGWNQIEMKTSSYVFERGDMPESRLDRLGRAIWTADSGVIYVNCACCGEITRLDGEFKILSSGYGTVCSVCTGCGCHVWAYFHGWDEADDDLRERYRFAPTRRTVMKHADVQDPRVGLS